MSDADELPQFDDTQPSLIGDMANLIARRGHGNGRPLPLPKENIAQLRQSCFHNYQNTYES